MRKFLIGLFALTVLTTGLAMAADSGPKGDIAALRAAAARPNTKIENVHVVGNYAILDWIVPPAGGESVYKRVSGKWKVLMSGGGAYVTSDLVNKGVPSSIAHKLLPGRP
jgi:hypothetical protein